MENNYQGCRDDQSEIQKEKNYKLAEVCTSPLPVEWIEKTSWVSYPLRDQNGSLTCVTSSYATEMGIISQQKYSTWIDWSSSFPYNQRGGTYGGCSSSDIYSVFPKLGNVFESIMPSQNMHEAEVLAVERKNYYSDLAKPFCIKRVELPVDFETVCSTLQATGKGVMLWFHIGSNEWGPTPVFNGSSILSNHSVTAIEGGLINGKKHLRIMDSSGACFRFISKEYFKARCFLASYLKTFQILTVSENTLEPSFDGGVRSLQEILIFEGFLAVGLNTGFYGNLTRVAVKKFQNKYGLVSDGIAGKNTKAKLLELFP